LSCFWKGGPNLRSNSRFEGKWIQLEGESSLKDYLSCRVIEDLESKSILILQTHLINNWKLSLGKWIQDYEDAFTDLVLIGQKTWNNDEIKKRRFVQNAQNIGLVDTVFEELVSDKSFIETCNFLRSHAIRLDQQYKEKAARHIYNASQSSNRDKKDKVKKVLALISEIQIQDSCSSDEESVAVPLTKTAMVCRLAQISPEIWMTLPLEAKKWILR
jgi:hypothetical protein